MSKRPSDLGSDTHINKFVGQKSPLMGSMITVLQKQFPSANARDIQTTIDLAIKHLDIDVGEISDNDVDEIIVLASTIMIERNYDIKAREIMKHQHNSLDNKENILAIVDVMIQLREYLLETARALDQNVDDVVFKEITREISSAFEMAEELRRTKSKPYESEKSPQQTLDRALDNVCAKINYKTPKKTGRMLKKELSRHQKYP
jgi:hypothetical protein